MRTRRQPPRPAHHRETLASLCQFLITEAGVPPALCEPMVTELVALRARCCPRLAMLESGQMPIAAMHPDAGRSLCPADFDSVLICHLYGMPQAVIATVTGKGESLVVEYLDLIDKYLKDVDTMCGHLRERGVKMPSTYSGHLSAPSATWQDAARTVANSKCRSSPWR